MEKKNRRCYLLIRLLAVLLAGVMLCGSAALAEIKVSINGVEQEQAGGKTPDDKAASPEMRKESRPEAADFLQRNEETEEPETAAAENLSAKAANGTPSFTCASSITVGKKLTVTVKAVQNMVNYHLSVVDSKGRRVFVAFDNGLKSKIVLDSLLFDAGKYWIYITAYYKDGSSQYAEKAVTVTDPNGQRVKRTIEIVPDVAKPLVNTTVNVTLRSSGAEKFAVKTGIVYYEYDSDNDQRQYYSYDMVDDYTIFDAYGETEFRYNLPYTRFAPDRTLNLCDLVLQVRAYYKGVWSSPVWKVIKLARPKWLGKPDVELPKTVFEGQDVEVTINKADGEDYYWIQVNGDEWFYCEEDVYYIPEENFKPGTENTIDVYSYSEQPGIAGSDSDFCSKTFFVYKKERPATPQLTTEKTAYWMNEEIDFTVESTKATEFRFRYKFFDQAWGESSGRIIKEPVDGQAKLTMWWVTPDNTTKVRVWASALIDGIWTKEAVVTVEIKKRPGWVGDVLWLPEGLTEIEADAFAGITTRAITIPASVTRIEAGAFSGNDRLGSVDIYAKDITIEEGAFSDCPNVYFYVVSGSSAIEYLENHDLPYKLI